MSAVDLTGKVALVTGGAGGIGFATVRLLLERGASVAMADIDLDRARNAAATLESGRLLPLGADLADESAIKAMVAGAVGHFGRLDILHNNAAALAPEITSRDGDIGAMDSEIWDRTFAVNCRGTMIVTREAMPHLIESRGTIVNTVSHTAFRGDFMTAYSSSKAALVQMTRCIAASHGPLGVRCNAVAPGAVLSPTVLKDVPKNVLEVYEEETLRDRLAEPEDIAEVVAFLASDAARNVTGQVIIADGGFSSHIPGYARVRKLFQG